MVTIWRTVMVGIVCVVFATPAYAACGWVLWAENETSSMSYRTADAQVPGGKTNSRQTHSWTIIGAYPSHGQCRDQENWKIASMLDGWRKQEAEAQFGEHTITHDPGSNISQRSDYKDEHTTSTHWTSIRYLCLPDTIDPRGPRGR